MYIPSSFQNSWFVLWPPLLYHLPELLLHWIICCSIIQLLPTLFSHWQPRAMVCTFSSSLVNSHANCISGSSKALFSGALELMPGVLWKLAPGVWSVSMITNWWPYTCASNLSQASSSFSHVHTTFPPALLLLRCMQLTAHSAAMLPLALTGMHHTARKVLCRGCSNTALGLILQHLPGFQMQFSVPADILQ